MTEYIPKDGEDCKEGFYKASSWNGETCKPCPGDLSNSNPKNSVWCSNGQKDESQTLTSALLDIESITSATSELSPAAEILPEYATTEAVELTNTTMDTNTNTAFMILNIAPYVLGALVIIFFLWVGYKLYKKISKSYDRAVAVKYSQGQQQSPDAGSTQAEADESLEV